MTEERTRGMTRAILENCMMSGALEVMIWTGCLIGWKMVLVWLLKMMMGDLCKSKEPGKAALLIDSLTFTYQSPPPLVTSVYDVGRELDFPCVPISPQLNRV